jgi:hypothetical protein
MIEHLDFHKLTGTYQVTGNLDVGLRGRGVAARVIVREHDGGSSGDDREPEHLPRVDKDGIERPD